jgi:hypothetical protein
MPTRLLQGRIQHVSGSLARAINDFEAMAVGPISTGGTLSGEDESAGCTFGDARFLQR